MNKTLLLALPAILACAPPPGSALAGTRWTIARIDGAPMVSDRARFEFDANRISATAGCNSLGGEWRVKGNRIEAGPFVSTQMYCDGLMEQERALAAMLEAKPSFVRSAERLILTGGGHTAELVLAR